MGLAFELVDLDGLLVHLELWDLDLEEVIFHIRMDLVECEIFREDDRAGEWSKEALLHQEPIRLVIYKWTLALSGDREDVSGDRDGNILDLESCEGGYDDDSIASLEYVEGDLSLFFFDDIAFLDVYIRGFMGSVRIMVVRDVEYLEHRQKRGDDADDSIQDSLFCKFFLCMVG